MKSQVYTTKDFLVTANTELICLFLFPPLPECMNNKTENYKQYMKLQTIVLGDIKIICFEGMMCKMIKAVVHRMKNKEAMGAFKPVTDFLEGFLIVVC